MLNPAARGVIALVAAASLVGGCATGPAPGSASPTSASPLAGVQDPAVRAQIDWVKPLPGARAGSGLVRDGDRMLLVMDIANQAMWIDTSTEPPATSTVDLGSDPAPLPKDEKPDFEAALLGEVDLVAVPDLEEPSLPLPHLPETGDARLHL